MIILVGKSSPQLKWNWPMGTRFTFLWFSFIKGHTVTQSDNRWLWKADLTYLKPIPYLPLNPVKHQQIQLGQEAKEKYSGDSEALVHFWGMVQSWWRMGWDLRGKRMTQAQLPRAAPQLTFQRDAGVHRRNSTRTPSDNLHSHNHSRTEFTIKNESQSFYRKILIQELTGENLWESILCDEKQETSLMDNKRKSLFQPQIYLFAFIFWISEAK